MNDAPSETSERTVYASIASPIHLKLPNPELPVSHRGLSSRKPGPSVPKVAINKYGDAMQNEYEIGSPWQLGIMPPKSEAKSIERRG